MDQLDQRSKLSTVGLVCAHGRRSFLLIVCLLWVISADVFSRSNHAFTPLTLITCILAAQFSYDTFKKKNLCPWFRF